MRYCTKFLELSINLSLISNKNKMNKLLLILLIFPLSVFSQVQATQVNITTKNVELADKRDAVINITKPNTMNLDNVKGFVLVNCSRDYTGLYEKLFRKEIGKEFAMSPFEFISKKKKAQSFGMKKGYIYI